MRPHPLAATATLALVTLGATACGSSSSHAAPPQKLTASITATTDASSSVASAGPVSSSSSPQSVNDAAAAGGGAIDACSLLTGAQVSALSGKKVGPGVESVLSPGADQCEYPYSGPSIGTDLIVYEPSTGITLSELQVQLSSEGTVRQISGVGDKAEFAGIDLDVVAGRYVFDVSGAGGLNDPTPAIAIAKVVVPELASK
jgi:hypothetical protein